MTIPREPRKMTTSRPKLHGWDAIRARDRQALAEMDGRPFTVPEFCERMARLLAQEAGVYRSQSTRQLVGQLES